MEPYAQITGTAKLYLAPVREPPPNISAGAPSGNWVYLGETEGDQSIQFAGALTFFRTNERGGPVKAVRPEEDVIISFTLVETTLENIARALHRASLVTTATNPEQRRMPFKRGLCPSEYALLMWGEADSPYGLYPGYNYLPRCVSASEPTITRSRTGRAAIECVFQALEDPQQADGDALGWAVVQTGA
jgi:hypothetical protein